MTQPFVDSAATFRTVLNLEAKSGYANHTVIGGLDKYVARWVSQFLSGHDFSLLHRQLKTLLLSPPAYAERSIDARRIWVESVLQGLDRVEKGRGIPAQEVKAPKKPQPGAVAVASLDSPVAGVKGVGQTIAGRLARLGVECIRDLSLIHI